MTSARDIFLAAARAIGWDLPESDSLEALEQACMRRIDSVRGGQDHAHAKNAIRSAVEAAQIGNVEYARAGLWEAAKVIDLHVWDRNPARMEGVPDRDSAPLG